MKEEEEGRWRGIQNRWRKKRARRRGCRSGEKGYNRGRTEGRGGVKMVYGKDESENGR